MPWSHRAASVCDAAACEPTQVEVTCDMLRACDMPLVTGALGFAMVPVRVLAASLPAAAAVVHGTAGTELVRGSAADHPSDSFGCVEP